MAWKSGDQDTGSTPVGAGLSLPVLLALLAAVGCAHAPGLRGPEAPGPVTEEAEDLVLLEAEVERAAWEADEEVAEAVEEADAEEDAGVLEGVNPTDFDFPFHYNERVGFWVDYFAGRNRERFALWLARKGRYEAFIREQLRARGLPQDLIYLAMVESGFSPQALSRAKAVGIWQFMAGTARLEGLEVSEYVDERRDPVRSTEAALNHLKKLYDQFGSWYLAAAAYNAGPGRIARILEERVGGARGADSLLWKIEDALPAETRNYVPRILAAAIVSKYAERFGFGDVEPLPPDTFDVVEVPDATELAVIAQAAGAPEEEIKRLNPHFYRGVTPPGRAVTVRIPAGRAEAFAVAYAKIPPERRVRVKQHVVKKGETLSGIAARYGVTVAALRKANRLEGKDDRRLPVGKRLRIPTDGGEVLLAGAAAPPEPESSRAAAAPAEGQGEARAEKAEGAARDGQVTRKTLGRKTYRVRQGDTLWRIATQHGVTVEQLRAWNGLGKESTIRPGQTLVVNPGETVLVYRVQRGDTLWGIARRHGVSPKQLMEWNDLTEDAVLRPGDEVKVRLGG
jgi:membrane-bound lytic murein transglycosylase D